MIAERNGDLRRLDGVTARSTHGNGISSNQVAAKTGVSGRELIRSHTDKYRHELTIGQVELLGTALSEMGLSMSDTAAMADLLAGTSTDDADVLDAGLHQALNHDAVMMELDDLLLRPNYAAQEDQDGVTRPRWRPRVIRRSTEDQAPDSTDS